METFLITEVPNGLTHVSFGGVDAEVCPVVDDGRLALQKLR